MMRTDAVFRVILNQTISTAFRVESREGRYLNLNFVGAMYLAKVGHPHLESNATLTTPRSTLCSLASRRLSTTFTATSSDVWSTSTTPTAPTSQTRSDERRPRDRRRLKGESNGRKGFEQSQYSSRASCLLCLCEQHFGRSSRWLCAVVCKEERVVPYRPL